MDKADREVLRVTQDRAGFDRLDAWLARQEEPVGSVTMESSGHYWMPLASHLQHQGVPVVVVDPCERSTLPRAGWTAPSPTRPMRGASR